MSAKESKKAKKDAAEKKAEKKSVEKAEANKESVEDLEPFLEGGHGDNHATNMTFDHGGFPLYVKALWGLFLLSAATYLYLYALPDLSLWGSP